MRIALWSSNGRHNAHTSNRRVGLTERVRYGPLASERLVSLSRIVPRLTLKTTSSQGTTGSSLMDQGDPAPSSADSNRVSAVRGLRSDAGAERPTGAELLSDVVATPWIPPHLSSRPQRVLFIGEVVVCGLAERADIHLLARPIELLLCCRRNCGILDSIRIPFPGVEASRLRGSG